RGLTESLIAYGLGRPYGFTDFDLAEEIIDHVQSNRYRLKTFIHSLIQSEKFQSKSL
ncbi:MAG: DUF1585 domain-containing protein, partial [Planctomicrobium sp.]|nr:DUF1585 domain-containing protein [Planctomicrobium sp.]